MTNLKSKAVADTAWLHLRDSAGNLMYADGPIGEDGEPTKIKSEVEVFSPGSREHAQAEAKRQSRNITRLRKKGNIDLSGDDTTIENAEYLASVTKGWRGVEYEGVTGSDMSLAIYKDRSIGFIADQVTEFRGDWENFPKRSPTN